MSKPVSGFTHAWSVEVQTLTYLPRTGKPYRELVFFFFLSAALHLILLLSLDSSISPKTKTVTGEQVISLFISSESTFRTPERKAYSSDTPHHGLRSGAVHEYPAILAWENTPEPTERNTELGLHLEQQDLIPLNEIVPVYPVSYRNLVLTEAYVILDIRLTKEGEVMAMEVVETYPEGYSEFAQAALQAFADSAFRPPADIQTIYRVRVDFSR